MKNAQCFAVLTGDVIKSRFLSKGEMTSVRSSLFNAADRMKEWKRGLIRGKLEFFRGDGWQLLISEPALAMRAGILLRASLLADGKADSRVSIGIGKVEQISSSRVSLSTGEAFLLSGHGLDDMTMYSNMTIEVSEAAGPLRDWLPVIGHLCDSLIFNWTRRQAEIVCEAVQPDEPSHHEVAQRLKPPVSKQTVTKALKSVNCHVIRKIIHLFVQTEWRALPLPVNHRQPQMAVCR